MVYESSLVAQGALASYGVSYSEAGRLPATYVQRVLTGIQPPKPAGGVTQQDGVGGQPKNGARDWRHDPAGGAAARGRGDSVILS